MKLNIRKYYYNQCNPFKSLEPDDPRNVDLDSFGPEKVRGINWAERLVEAITLSDEPVCKLFTGLPGSGKTTELKRLVNQLSDPQIGNLFPVFIDAEEVIDLVNPIDVTDIISAIMFCTVKAVAVAEGKDPEKALEQGYFERFWEWIKNTDISIKNGEIGISSTSKLVVEMKTRPNLREKIRNTVAAHFTRFIKEARDELELIQEQVRENFEKDGIVIIFDSLEKLRGITTNWDNVLESAAQVFMGNAPYVHLPVHVLYTVPASLTTRMRNIDFLPMVKVRDKSGNPHTPGLEAARELIRKRVPDNILKELFGPEYMDRMDTLILSSGGYPREIIQMMQKVIAQTEYPVSDRNFEHIIKEIANEYREIILGEHIEWLARIAVTRELIPENEDARRDAALLLQNHAVLRYLNDDLWFDIHPAIRKIPGVKKAIENLEAGRANCEE